MILANSQNLNTIEVFDVKTYNIAQCPQINCGHFGVLYIYAPSQKGNESSQKGNKNNGGIYMG